MSPRSRRGAPRSAAPAPPASSTSTWCSATWPRASSTTASASGTWPAASQTPSLRVFLQHGASRERGSVMVLPLEGWLVPCVQPYAACCPRSLPLLLLPTLLASFLCFSRPPKPGCFASLLPPYHITPPPRDQPRRSPSPLGARGGAELSGAACGELQAVSKRRKEASAALRLLPGCRSLPAAPVKSFGFAFPAGMRRG